MIHYLSIEPYKPSDEYIQQCKEQELMPWHNWLDYVADNICKWAIGRTGRAVILVTDEPTIKALKGADIHSNCITFEYELRGQVTISALIGHQIICPTNF